MKKRGKKQKRYTKKDFLLDLQYIVIPALVIGISWLAYITIYYIVK